ncbi:MAG: DUF4867 family protein [Bacteroidetes bacterium]|nr:DUF4867 family protein [Bacteroidota bacterium]MCL6103698.1 DUF4867 family protein [Bacteroidota bacterium]
MNLKELAGLNDRILIREVHDRSFAPYGKVITGYDFSDLTDYLEKETGVPDQGNIYKASVPELEQFPVKQSVADQFYGEMPIEIGYCNGRNSTLNGLEYHLGSEINIAVTDMVLMLGKLQNLKDNTYRSDEVEAFFVPKDTAIQLYETTLHFSPCKTDPGGFKCIVILPRGTNEPLKNDNAKHGEKLLFARNKWLLAHPDRKPLIEKGAWPGIIGENLEIKIS